MSIDWPVTEEGSIIIRQIAVFDLKSFPKFFHNTDDFDEEILDWITFLPHV